MSERVPVPSCGYDILSDRTSDLMCMSDVHRWVVIKTLRHQSLAEHAFNVAIIAMELMSRLGLQAWELPVLWWALTHDAPEVLTGDIDGKFKRDNYELRTNLMIAENAAIPWYRAQFHTVHPITVALVKVADKMEALHYIRTWGTGVRADDVFRELESIFWTETVPTLMKRLQESGLDVTHVEGAVRFIYNHSITEGGCVQLRRHRQTAAAHILTKESDR